MKPPVFDIQWSQDILALYRHDIQEIWDSKIAPQIWNQYHNQLQIYRSFVDDRIPLDILDVGCAQATLALLLAEHGHRVWAIDIRQQFLEYAASRYERGEIHFICGNAMELELLERFDIIYVNQILEHLICPAKLLQKLAQWLKPNGRLIATTPNGHYLKNTLPSFSSLGDPSQYEHLQFTADGDGHFFAYREDELRSLFRQAQFKTIQTRYFESPWISGHMKIRYLHRYCAASVLRFLDRLFLAIPFLNKRLSHQILIEGAL